MYKNHVGKTHFLSMMAAKSLSLLHRWLAEFVVMLSCVMATGAFAAVNDLSNDKKSDLIFRNAGTGQISAWLMNGSAPTAQAGLVAPGNWTVTHIADFNADGKADLLFRHDNGSVTLWIMNGVSVTSSTGLLGAEPDWRVSHVADFNGDGKADILWRNASGAVTVWLMDGINVTSRVGLLGPDPSWSVSHVGDFNGDGRADILWRNNNGAVTAWLMNGSSVTTAVGLLGADADWRVSHVADFNGDGKADLLWRHTNGAVTAWLMNGVVVTTAAGLLGADANWSVSHTGDFNGDGKADLLWRNTNGAVTQWLMNGAALTASAGLLGADANWRVTHLGDYNGDGKADLLWRNTNDGAITMWLMNGAAVTERTGILGASDWRILPTQDDPKPVIIIDPSPQADAARFLTQATFGPNMAAINEVTNKGYVRWIDDQFALPATSHTQLAAAANTRRAQQYNEYLDVHTAIWTAAIGGTDQLRQRVANAYSQIFVVNVRNSAPPLYEYFDSAANYYDMLGRHADGNFRALIEDVTRHPVMGLYLSHLANQKEDAASGRQPDQNFAREILQLFTIGLYELNADGTTKTGANGKPIETYTQADIEGLAKVFTGWSYDTGPTLNPDHFPPYTRANNTLGREFRWKAMRLYPSQHSPSAKSFLGANVAAGTAGEQALKIALDKLFNHPNVGPFIGKQLIQRMVTSNPSRAYVGRVSAAFANNGRGVRGDMAAVIRAILLDPEARDGNLAVTSPTWGRLKEPVIRVTNIYRALEATPSNGDWNFLWNNGGEDGIGQAPFSAPSVFNYYRPGFVPAETAIARAGMVAPELQITNEVSTIGWTRTVQDMMRYQANFPASLPLNNEIALAADATALTQRLNLLLTGRTMSTPTFNLIRDAIASMPAGTVEEKRKRVWAAVTLVTSSTEFLVQK
jgi:uncharacterized protein (DUF1800 family)